MGSPIRLERSFYARPTLVVAREMVGKILVHRTEQERRAGRIVEVEAYVGPEDRASHASRGRTARTEIMFGPPGYAYVYLIYGMYHCLNAVTEPKGFPAAVLIRALEPLAGVEGPTSGPGRLCRAMGIDRALNGTDLSGDLLYLEDDGCSPDPAAIRAGPRVGVEYAGEWASRPWRLYLDGSPWVSRPARSATPRRGRVTG